MALCGVALLCALGLSQRPVKGASCRPGHFLRGSGTDQRCCHSCTPGKWWQGTGVGGGAPPQAQTWPLSPNKGGHRAITQPGDKLSQLWLVRSQREVEVPSWASGPRARKQE
jgi:hypothetical protein